MNEKKKEKKKMEDERKKIAKEIENERRKIAKEEVDEAVKIYDEIAKRTTAYFSRMGRKNFIIKHEEFLTALKPILSKKPVKATTLDTCVKTKAPNLLNAAVKLGEDPVKWFSQLYEKKTPRDFVEALIGIKEKLLRFIDSINQGLEEVSFSHF